MITIHKYPLQIGHATEVTFPAGSEQEQPEILTVHAQGDQSVVLWAQIQNDGQWVVKRRFQVIGTGWAIHPGWKYIGTCHEYVGLDHYVWHVFEDLSS